MEQVKFSIILKEIRIDHYIKNIVIFIPFILNNQYWNTYNLLQVFLLFLAFCLTCSSIYIFNDLKDKEKDKSHPYKRNRPIAQNLIPTRLAIILMVICFLGGIFISFYLKIYSFIILYLLLNLFYSFYLRELFLIDAICIATGFILRILSSFCLLNMPINFLIIGWMFFTSLLVTFIKRKLELKTIKKGFQEFRSCLNPVKTKKINIIIFINAILSVGFFIFVMKDYASWIKCFILGGCYIMIVWRFLSLSNKNYDFDDPINFIKQDLILKSVLFVSLLFLTLYN